MTIAQMSDRVIWVLVIVLGIMLLLETREKAHKAMGPEGCTPTRGTACA